MNKTRNRSHISVDSKNSDKAAKLKHRADRSRWLPSLLAVICALVLVAGFPAQVKAWVSDSRGNNNNQDIIDASLSGTGK